MTMLVDEVSRLVVSVGIPTVTKATVALLIALAAVRVARRRRASVRHLLLAAGFGTLLVMPLAVVLAPSVRVPVAPMPEIVDDYIFGAASIEETVSLGTAPAPGSVATPERRWHVSAATLVAVVWMGGLLWFGMPVAIGLLQVSRLRRTGQPWRRGQRLVDSLVREAGVRRVIDVVRHESITVPATCGLRRHLVLFPMDADAWTDDEVTRAAVHEVEHVRRADCVVNAAARAICAAYWFHPLVWVAWRQLALEAERACDDVVLHRSKPDAYADQLVTLARRLSASARHPMLAMANRRDLVHRVRAVLDQRQARGRAGLGPVVAIGAAAAAVVVTLAPLQAVSPLERVIIRQDAAGPATPQFEVATIKINRSGDRRATHNVIPASGRLTITNVTVSSLIQEAYGVPLPSQLVDVPDWAKTTRVDVVAKAASATPARSLQQMLQPLLAEYFALAVRREMRDMDVFAMVMARPGQLGPQLRRNEGACDDIVGTAGGFARAPENAPNEKGTCGILPGGAGRIVARGLDMPGLAAFIGTSPGRMVLDRTNLTGRFDVDLTYTPSSFSAQALAQRAGASPPPGVDPSGPPLITALREQLGVRLEPVRAPVEVLVIERIEPRAEPRPAASQEATPAPVQARPAFDVASVRRNTDGTGAPTSRVEGGRYLASNVPLQLLIADAYRLPIVGGPDWTRSTPGPKRPGDVRFDVNAVIPPGTPAARIPLMLRALLEERFGLLAHTAAQDREVFALVLARADKRLGSHLVRSTQECRTEIEAGPLRAPVRRVADDGKPLCSMMLGPAAIRGGGLPMPFLAGALTPYAGRMVVDRTGLDGPFDFELTYAPAGRAGGPVARGGGPAAPDDRPSIFAAVQEQLGLKLEPATASVDVLVIDAVSMPTDN